MFRAARFCTLSFRSHPSVKDKIVNVLGFIGPPVSEATTQFYHFSAKAAIDRWINEHGFVKKKKRQKKKNSYLQKQAMGQIWLIHKLYESITIIKGTTNKFKAMCAFYQVRYLLKNLNVVVSNIVLRTILSFKEKDK